MLPWAIRLHIDVKWITEKYSTIPKSFKFKWALLDLDTKEEILKKKPYQKT